MDYFFRRFFLGGGWVTFGASNNITKSACLYVGSGVYVSVVPTNFSNSWDVTAYTTASGAGTPVHVGSPTNMVLNSSTANWDAFADPSTPGQFWIIAGPNSNAGAVWRVNGTVLGTAVTMNSVATADDTLTIYAVQTAYTLFAVHQPVTSLYVDWLLTIEPTNGTYAMAGDYTSLSTAPNPPTLTEPNNGQSIDVSAGVTVGGYYNSTDMQNMNAYALQIKTSSGSWQYYNASGGSLQSTIVWNTLVTQIVPGGFFQVSLSPTLVSDGNVYNWSFASQEAAQNLQGSFATPFTFTGMTAPPMFGDFSDRCSRSWSAYSYLDRVITVWFHTDRL